MYLDIDLLKEENWLAKHNKNQKALESAILALVDSLEFGVLVPAVSIVTGIPTAIPETYYLHADIYKDYRVVSREEFDVLIEETLRQIKAVWN